MLPFLHKNSRKYNLEKKINLLEIIILIGENDYRFSSEQTSS